jgi:hypothetical protein
MLGNCYKINFKFQNKKQLCLLNSTTVTSSTVNSTTITSSPVNSITVYKNHI